MSAPPTVALEHRLLVLAPVGRDAALIAEQLAANVVDCIACRNVEHLALELERGAAAILVAEEGLGGHNGRLATLLARQPPWSDLPVLLLTRTGSESPVAARMLRTLGNVTLLERPVRVAALVSAVRSALRARARQYEARAHLNEREAADEAKNRFLATLAHELRNPLAPIRNSLSLIQLTGATTSSVSAFEIMDRQVTHMARLIDDLMDVSRITRGKIDLRKTAVSLGTVLATAIETSRPLIDAGNHELVVSIPDEPLPLDADPVRLAQVFSNLLNNAAKYTDPGGRVTIAARRDGDSAVVTVGDTGVGIPASALTHVFEMFAQVNARDRRSQSGLGIGLALARSLVEMHGGSVVATSEGEGKGSVFTVRLPLGVGAVPEPPITVPPRATAMQRVLVVDDNRDAANTLGALLQLIGADVRVVYDGEAALAAFAEFRPSVVLLDIGMPGMDGYEVARRLRAERGARDTTLVALTGWGEAGDRQRSRDAGFHHHLVKPVDVNAVEAVLATQPADAAPVGATRRRWGLPM